MSEETSLYDTAEYLDSPERMAAYVEAALEEGDAALHEALGTIARARGTDWIAREAGLSRRELDETLSGSGRLTVGVLARVLRALGVRLSAVPA